MKNEEMRHGTMHKRSKYSLARYLLPAVMIVFLLLTACGQKKELLGDEEQMRNDTDIIIKYAEQLLSENSPLQAGEFTWDMERKERSWTYYTGCMMDAFLRIYNLDRDKYAKFYEWVDDFYNHLIVSDADTYTLGDQYVLGELDSVACGHPLFELLSLEKEAGEAYNEKYVGVAEWIYSQLQIQTKFDECDGNFIHKMNNKNWKTWNVALDGLYMSNPFLMEYADFTEQEGNAEKAGEIRSAAAKRLHWISENLLRDNGLYAHAYSVSLKTTNDISWLRAIGWYSMAMSKVIDSLPVGDEKQMLQKDMIRFLDGMLKFSDTDTGLWFNVVDETDTTLDENYLETSGSAMVSYSLMHAYRMGYADKTYFDAGYKAFHSVVETKLTEKEGRLSIGDIYKKSGVETEKKNYLKEDRSSDEAKGTAAVIMAAIELIELLDK